MSRRALVAAMAATHLVAGASPTLPAGREPPRYKPQVVRIATATAEVRQIRALVTAAGKAVAEADGAREAIWERLAECETGAWIDGGRAFVEGSARWDASDGLFEGGIQFHPDTWDAFRDPDMPAAAYLATRAQQIEVGERVLAAQGWRAWPACSERLGYGN